MDAVLAAADRHAAALTLLSWIGQALLFGTALAGLTWLMTRLLRHRIPPGVEAALWLIVLFKFLVPVGPGWSLSSIYVYDRFSRAWSLPATVPEGSPSPIIEGVDLATASTPVRNQPPVSPDVASRPPGWITIVATGYLAGVLSLLVWRARAYQMFRRRCRTFSLAGPRARDLVADVCRRLRVRRIPSIRISDEHPAPFVTGLFRPLLVLAHRQLVRPDELEAVVVHEVAHLRRGDLFVRQLQWIAGALLFFWPIVAWVNRRLDVAREQACDQWALRHGKLPAGAYARCLLQAIPAARTSRLAFHPAGMASGHTNLERRIDMVLESSTELPDRRKRGRLTIVLLTAWSGFALAGGAGAGQSAPATYPPRPATEEAVREHAVQLYQLVAEHAVADFNGDSVLSYLEKDVYLVALAMQRPEEFMSEFPYADRNHSECLDLLEAYDVIRGVTLVAYADRRPTAAPGAVLDLEFYHEALNAQRWLLDRMKTEPEARDLDNIWSVLKRVECPQCDHARKLNHGGPDRSHKPSCPSRDRGRFQELEGNIAALEAKLVVASDAAEIARLQGMLAKLKAILAKLRDS